MTLEHPLSQSAFGRFFYAYKAQIKYLSARVFSATRRMSLKDLTPLYHALAAVSVQCLIGFLLDEWAFGGVVGCVWFVAREQTQAEYRWIARFGYGKRATMPWWGGFDYRVWDAGSALDYLVPVFSCLIVYSLV